MSSRRLALNPLAGISSGWVLGAEVVGPARCLDDEHVAVGDLPPQPRLVECLVDRPWVLVEHDTEAVPGHRADAEHVVGVGDAV